MLSDAVLDAIRKSVRKITPNAKLEIEDIKEVLANEVVKREIFEGDKADEAKKKITKALKALEGKKPNAPPASGKPSDSV